MKTPKTNYRPRFINLTFKSNSLYLYSIFLCFIILLYVLNLNSPLRLNTDAISYFSLEETIENGTPGIIKGVKSHFSLGYPYYLWMLNKINLLASPFIILSNIIFIFITLFFISKLLYSEKAIAVNNDLIQLITITLLSWIIIKHFTLPLPDILYLGISFCSLYFMHLYMKRHLVKLIIIAFILCLIAIMLRVIGISLIAIMVFVLYKVQRQKAKHPTTSNKATIFIILFVILMLSIGSTLLGFEQPSIYIKEFLSRISQSENKHNYIFNNLKGHFIELGEIFVNAPFSKIDIIIPHTISVLVFIAFGTICFTIIAATLWFKRKSLDLPHIYLLVYSPIILIWPWHDARFWLPVLPIIYYIIFIDKAFIRFRFYTALKKVYLTYFLIIGLCALLYTTKLSLNRESFPYLYSKQFIKAYSQHYGKNKIGAQDGLNESALKILNKYNK